MNLGIHNQTPPEEFISVNVKCVPCDPPVAVSETGEMKELGRKGE